MRGEAQQTGRPEARYGDCSPKSRAARPSWTVNGGVWASGKFTPLPLSFAPVRECRREAIAVSLLVERKFHWSVPLSNSRPSLGASSLRGWQ